MHHILKPHTLLSLEMLSQTLRTHSHSNSLQFLSFLPFLCEWMLCRTQPLYCLFKLSLSGLLMTPSNCSYHVILPGIINRSVISCFTLIFIASVRCSLKASKTNIGRSCQSPRCLIQTVVNQSMIRPPKSNVPLFKFHYDPGWYLSFGIVFLLKILHGGKFLPHLPKH
jgi:hypothetical protein